MAKLTREEFEVAVSFPKGTAAARLKALGKMLECSRCLGSGRYSFTPMYGDRCFKCAGAGVQFPVFTRKLINEVKTLVEAGALSDYLAQVRRVQAAHKAIKSASREARAILKPIADLYEVAYRIHSSDSFKAVPSPRKIPEWLFAAQTLSNSLVYGWYAKTIPCMSLDGLSMRCSSKLSDEDVLSCARQAEWILEQARMLVSEFTKFAEGYTPEAQSATAP